MGNNNSSPSPPPSPPPPGPDLTFEINNRKSSIKKNIDSINNERDYTTNVANEMANYTNTFLDYATNKIPRILSEYRSETMNLVNERNYKIGEENSIKLLINANLEILKTSTKDNLDQTTIMNDHIEEVYQDTYNNNVIDKSIIATSEQYYDALHSENSMLNNNMKQTLDNYSADTNKPKYLEDTASTLKFINNIVFIMYYFLIFVLVFFLYDKEIPFSSKAILVIILLLFPFFITELQDNLKTLYFKFIYNK